MFIVTGMNDCHERESESARPHAESMWWRKASEDRMENDQGLVILLPITH